MTHLRIVTSRSGAAREIDLRAPRLWLAVLLVAAALFAAGIALGGFLSGVTAEQRAYALAVAQQRQDLQAARGQIDGTVAALASRVGTLNAQLIRLDALGRRLTDLAGLDRGEFDFEQAPPAGGPEGEAPAGDGSAQVPDIAAVLHTLESRIDDRARQLAALETLLATRELRERTIPGGLPLIGGWISSHFGHRTDPISGRAAFHAGVDFAGAPGSPVIAVGPGVVTFAGYKAGYGNLVEITHPTGYMTRYGHNARNLVRVGQSVRKGDRVAIIGSTGRSTGTHVHFEVLRDGNVLNPSRYLAAP